jgi:hypothetical protein
MASKRETTADHARPRTIIGVSLSPDVAAAMKAEAKRRGMRLKELVMEMWDAYRAAPRK